MDTIKCPLCGREEESNPFNVMDDAIGYPCGTIQFTHPSNNPKSMNSYKVTKECRDRIIANPDGHPVVTSHHPSPFTGQYHV